MAEQTRSAKPSFYEVVFRGKPKVVRAFMHGLTLGAGGKAQYFYSYDEGIRQDGAVERLAGKVGLRATEVHVVVDAATSKLIKSLRKRIVDQTGLEIANHRRIRSARLAFAFKAYTPQHDAEILKAVKGLPKGVRVEGFEHEVKSNPAARGVEAYAPSHHYEAAGKGVVVGPVDALVGLRQKVKEYPLIDVQEIELVLA